MPTKPAKGNSWRVQFRLNPDMSEEDRQLLEVLNGLSEQKHSDRDICVTALWNYYIENGQEPVSTDMRNLRDIRLQLKALRDELDQKIGQAIQAIHDIPGINLGDFRNARGQTLDDAVGERVGYDVLNNILSGVSGEQFDDDEDSE